MTHLSEHACLTAPLRMFRDVFMALQKMPRRRIYVQSRAQQEFRTQSDE